MIKKYPHHSDLIFCRVPLLHTFPDNILTKYSREKLSYTEVHVFSKHNTFLGHFQLLICHALARAPGTEKGKKKKKKSKITDCASINMLKCEFYVFYHPKIRWKQLASTNLTNSFEKEELQLKIATGK